MDLNRRKVNGWTKEQQHALKFVVDAKNYYWGNPMECLSDIVVDKRVNDIAELPYHNSLNDYNQKRKNAKRTKDTLEEFNNSMDVLHDKYIESKKHNFNDTTRKMLRDVVAYLNNELEFVN